MTRTAFIIAAALTLAPAVALAQDVKPVEVTGSFSVGLQQFDNDTNSSKFNEYRDIRDNLSLFSLKLGLDDPAGARYFDLFGTNLTRDDQTLRAAGGVYGQWRVGLDWNDTPHLFSNKAQTAFIQRGPGLFEVPATIPITFKRLATAAADAPGVVASDGVIAAFQSSFLRPTDLGTIVRHGRAAFEYTGSETLTFGIAYDLRKKRGSRPGFGPIGDRPPRTLNVQLAEPVDHRTQDVTFTAEHVGRAFQVQASYLFSDFANRVDTLVWQNMYTTALPGADFDVWDRAVSLYGRRPLAPDNRYHHARVAVGADLAADSRLSLTAAYGRLDQDEALLPYSVHTAIANPSLPRASANAKMNTVQLGADYTISPTPLLNVRAFVRRFDLDNKTPEARWQYVTSDTSNLNGTVSYKNKRINLAYEYDRTNLGAEATYRLRPVRGGLTFGYEREEISRAFREADSSENRLSASLRIRPSRWSNVRLRYVYADRDGGAYDGTVTQQSYWYAFAEADNDNPQFSFSNHPDMRRYDVSDRQRHQVDATLNLVPRDSLTVAASVRYRSDDFESGVGPSQPLVGLNVAERQATTPGDQLGLLEDSRLRYALDLFGMPNERVTLNAFLSWDKGASLMRSLEYNENNKLNPGAIQTAELGPWTRAGNQWSADTGDVTTTFGAGATFLTAPDGVSVSLTYTVSLSDIDIAYAGFGVTNWDGTPYPPNHQFAFPATPPAISNDLHVFDTRVEIPLVRGVAMTMGYLFERYRLDDWQQSDGQSFFESVGSEFLLRDTSRSHQWGNRLFNLGTYLAPNYTAHVGYAAFSYRF